MQKNDENVQGGSNNMVNEDMVVVGVFFFLSSELCFCYFHD